MKNFILEKVILAIDQGKKVTRVSVEPKYGQLGMKRGIILHLEDGSRLRRELELDFKTFRKQWKQLPRYKAIIEQMQGFDEPPES